ncbi:hypothetical protein CK203_042353 [Vitis vinifera]|uniref:SWIM-type domain-containing protein n=1 Tax=Vitis vinifera TaxID=29760 RepID=A0A438H583_VITVI|nr:hypothetical protein CK203_042353 [Vitis vinifera]
MDLENSIYGYLHEGGEIVPKEDKQIQYKGGQQKGMYIGQRMSYAEFVSKACERLDINSNGYTFHYTLEFDPSALQQLDDDEDMHMMLSHSYDYARIYVLKRTRRVEVEGGIVNVQNDYCHNSTEETHNSVASCQANNESNLGLSQGFMSRCAETEVMPHDLNVECSSQPSMRGRRGARIIEQVIRTTPEYLPRQICKDFRSRYGVSLSYKQAWTYKEMAKERIYGLPENSYMLLPWLCQRLVDINPGTIAEYSRQDGHFWQLFIAHSFSIQGFLMGCRPVIAIDSTHLSGPYRGSLFSATAYDADDGMFPIAFGVVSSEKYEDWLWFLQKLKGILQDKEVVIISDRHQAILRSVSQLFGVENHAYCYRHVKENFSSYVTKHSMKGKKCKMDALLLLDNVAYARLDDDYVVAMEKLKTYNSDLAKWVEENSPQHWAMSKFAKKRWDKMTTNLAESFNAWLKEERHYTIFNLVMTHMDKFAHLACAHMGSTENWKAAVGQRPRKNVNLRERTCTCKAWQMAGIPCEHACAAIRQMKQDVYEYVDSYFKLPMQQLIYSGHFNSIPNHNMPIVDADGCVRDAQGRLYPSLKPPCSKRPPGRPRHRRIESQFSSKRLIFCSRCQVAGHNRASCKNPLPAP